MEHAPHPAARHQHARQKHCKRLEQSKSEQRKHGQRARQHLRTKVGERHTAVRLRPVAASDSCSGDGNLFPTPRALHEAPRGCTALAVGCVRALDVSGSASRTWTVIIPVTAHEKAVPRDMSESSEAAACGQRRWMRHGRIQATAQQTPESRGLFALVCRQRLSFLRDMSSYVSAWCCAAAGAAPVRPGEQSQRRRERRRR